MPELARALERLIERFVLVLRRFAATARVILRYLETNSLRQAFDRLTKIEPLVIHHEADGIAASAATKAVVELALWVHREGGGFLVVERAAGAVVFACFFKLYAAIDDFNDIEAIQ